MYHIYIHAHVAKFIAVAPFCTEFPAAGIFLAACYIAIQKLPTWNSKSQETHQLYGSSALRNRGCVRRVGGAAECSLSHGPQPRQYYCCARYIVKHHH